MRIVRPKVTGVTFPYMYLLLYLNPSILSVFITRMFCHLDARVRRGRNDEAGSELLKYTARRVSSALYSWPKTV